jgi:hypothetical protein
MSKRTEEEERIWIKQQISNGHIPGGAMDITGGRTITRIDQGLHTPAQRTSQRQWIWDRLTHKWVSSRLI